MRTYLRTATCASHKNRYAQIMASVAPQPTPSSENKRPRRALKLAPRASALGADNLHTATPSQTYRPPVRIFSKSARLGLIALSEAMFEGAPGLSPTRFEAQIDALERVVAASSPRGQWGVRLAVWALRHGPLVCFGTFRCVENLELDTRIAYLERLELSAFSAVVLLFFAIRTLLIATFYEDAAAYADPVFVAVERSRNPIPAEAESGVRVNNSSALEPHDSTRVQTSARMAHSVSST
jgi:hypothetical protein